MPIFKGGAVSFRLVNSLIRGAHPAAAIMAAHTVCNRYFLDDQGVDFFWVFSGPGLAFDVVAGRAAAAFLVKELRGIGQVVFLLPEMAGGAEFAIIIESQ